MQGETMQVLMWILSGLLSLVILIGGAYMRKLAGDISKVETTHAAVLASIQSNCQQESLRLSVRGERISALETAQAILKEDLKYIRERVDEIATCLGTVAKRGE
jgi:hypothetical protein